MSEMIKTYSDFCVCGLKGHKIPAIENLGGAVVCLSWFLLVLPLLRLRLRLGRVVLSVARLWWLDVVEGERQWRKQAHSLNKFRRQGLTRTSSERTTMPST